ncbi:MAG TPA: CapA family protein, partial [Archangium sp.]|nr:CapA family protein [Archangium sp.]
GEDGPTHAGCMEAPAEDDPALPEGEREARRLYACTAISLTGRVVAADGTPVAGATVRVHGQRARTGRQGAFRFPTLPRRNALVEVEAGGFRPFVVPVELRRALGEAAVEVPALVLSPVAPEVARMLFTGDVMLGRRFLDPTDTTPPGRLPTDVPGAFIRVSAPDAGSRSVLGFVRPLFQGADLTAINLESPVTAAPATPHPSKSYTFFTLPGSLEALRWMGVGYVSLGNNHVHDYLEPGLADTLRHLKASGLGHSGAGPNADEAFRPWTSSLAGTSYSFLSMSSIFEWQKDAWDLLASDTTGGAADLRDNTRVARALRAEREAGRVPVALLHTGSEYSERPTPYTLERMRLVAKEGAALVIAHHPHVPQGLAWQEGVLVAQSLGNFTFDQDKLETMLGLVADVELRGAELSRASVLPVYLEDYRPRPVTGALADGELRRLSALSREGGVALVPHGPRGVVLPQGRQARTHERTLELTVEVSRRGWALVDLRPLLGPGESLATARVEVPGARLVAGRDLLLHGDFEDHDVDDRHTEAVQWEYLDTPGFVCQREPHTGAAALCLKGREGAGALALFRPRVRLPGDAENRPNRWLSVVGWARGAQAGRARMEVRYEPSLGGGLFGQQDVFRHEGGDFAWSRFEADLSLPPEPAKANSWNATRALRLFLFHSAPRAGEGLLAFDDLAVVAWEEAARGEPLTLETPHPRDFLRLEAPEGTYTVRLTLRTHALPLP